MKVILHSFTQKLDEVNAFWECRVRIPALFWAIPALTKAKVKVEFVENKHSVEHPYFWPKISDDGKCNTELSTQPINDLPSFQEEAIRCWNTAYNEILEVNNWLSMLGTDPIMCETLKMPFYRKRVLLRFTGTQETFETLINELCKETEFPETRLLGYLLCNKTIYKPITPAPRWVLQYL
jgi:hypothetical protein